MEIVIEGYASPLAEPDYNRNLTSRRISSLVNHLYQFNGGVLRPYLLNNQLQIRILPFGEEKAEKTVSDNAKDRRKSVYSVAAMKERKVEIKEINRLNDTIRSLSYELGKWEFEKSISLLNNRLEVESRLGHNMTNKGIPTSYGTSALTNKKMPTKQAVEIVLVDGFTGNVIDNDFNSSVQIVDEADNKVVGKAKRKGEGYRYDMPLEKPFLIKSSAAGYSTVTSGLNNLIETSAAGTVRHDTVYLTPFNGLPLPLYFDNDRPDQRSNKSKTALPYDKFYKQYASQKPEFVKRHKKLLASKGSIPSIVNEMSLFFDTDVKNGYDQLTGYVAIMESYLEDGYGIDVIIEGYASPLANAAYNEYLTNRRINSVINFFTVFQGGRLQQYIKNKQLNLKVRPLGESQAAPDVSDDSNDPQNSIYSVEASKERRVVIKDILIKKP